MFAFYPLGSDAVWSVGIILLQFFFYLLKKGRCQKSYKRVKGFGRFLKSAREQKGENFKKEVRGVLFLGFCVGFFMLFWDFGRFLKSALQKGCGLIS